MDLEQLKKQKEAPEWMQDNGFKTLSKGYLMPKETPRKMYERVSKASAKRLGMQHLEESFFDIMWNGWLGLASPVASNMGTDRGLPISCYSLSIPDSIYGIYSSVTEMAMLTKGGGGVGVYAGNIRGRGEPIKNNGKSEGIVPWLKVFDSAILATSQGSVRRGASAVYIDSHHKDVEEFLRIRRPEGDINRQCMNLHHAVCLNDDFMKGMLSGDKEKRELWQKVLESRLETGEPYIMFTDNVNNANPEAYKKNNLSVKTSNICCLSKNTEVLTEEGFCPISELVGKKTKIFDGIQWVENSSFELKGQAPLYRVTLKDGSHIDCTGNHRWFVSESYNEIASGKTKEVFTENLKPGTWLEFHNQTVNGNVTEKAAYLKGFLVGDGTSIKDRPVLNVHFTKYECLSQLLESANEIKDIKVNTSVKSGIAFSEEINNTDKYNTYGVQRFVRMQGLAARKKDLTKWVKDYKKELPKECVGWTENTKLNFLAGLFDADGTVGRCNTIQLSNVSLDFIKSLQRLLKSMAIWSSLDEAANAFRITLSSKNSYDLLQKAPFRRLKASGSMPNRITTGWRKIASIEKLEGVHDVFCPSVPSTGKFALANGLMTGNSEILLHTDDDHTFVCCLSSLNLAKYKEWTDWKDSEGRTVPYLSALFLDGVLQEFIDRARDVPGFERSVRSAEKGRALGLGVMGWHTYLQKEKIAMGSFAAKIQNKGIFSFIMKEAQKASKFLAKELGEPEWCKGTGMRNTHLIALAPTVSNATITGGVSPSIEPWAANAFNQKTAKGTFLTKNKELEVLLKEKGKNTKETWANIANNNGSVLHLDFLSDEEKEVFLTAREIDQRDLVQLAADRYPFIDQGQSLNLFFDLPTLDEDKKDFVKYFHDVHVKAWKLGVKTLYYVRSNSVLRTSEAPSFKRFMKKNEQECNACEG